MNDMAPFLLKVHLRWNNIRWYTTTPFLARRPPHRKPRTPIEIGTYLAGLIEGDGCFTGKRLRIAFHQNDKPLALEVQKMIGFGFLYPRKISQCTEYVLAKKAGFQKVFKRTNDYWFSPYKHGQILRNGLDSWSGVKLLPPSSVCLLSAFMLNSIRNSFWASGLLNSDGHIALQIVQKKGSHQENVKPAIFFVQKNAELPNALKTLFGRTVIRRKDGCFVWRIRSKNDIFRWINYMDFFPLQSHAKYKQYILFRRAFSYILGGKHLTTEGMMRIKVLQKRMRSQFL